MNRLNSPTSHATAHHSARDGYGAGKGSRTVGAFAISKNKGGGGPGSPRGLGGSPHQSNQLKTRSAVTKEHMTNDPTGILKKATQRKGKVAAQKMATVIENFLKSQQPASTSTTATTTILGSGGGGFGQQQHGTRGGHHNHIHNISGIFNQKLFLLQGKKN